MKDYKDDEVVMLREDFFQQEEIINLENTCGTITVVTYIEIILGKQPKTKKEERIAKRLMKMGFLKKDKDREYIPEEKEYFFIGNEEDFTNKTLIDYE